MAVDVRLAVPVGIGWASIAALQGVEGAARPACIVALAVALVTIALARAWVSARGMLTLVALSAATSGLLLGVVDARAPASLDGCGDMELTIGEHGGAPAQVTIDRAVCDDGEVAGGSAIALALDDPSGEPVPVALGDHVRASCEAWQADAATWMLDCDDVELQGRTWWAAWSGDVRAAFRTATEALPGEGGLLLPGLTIGDTSMVDPDLEAAMQAAGLTHLTAVSGANCAVIVALAFGLGVAVGLGRAGRVALGMGALVAFVVLVGPDPSVLRAGTMAMLALLALWRGARSAGVALVALAVLVLLVLQPQLATSAGLALSVLATCGLLLHGVPLTVWLARRIPVWLAAAIAVPLAAQLWCLPVLVALDARLSLIAVPANLLAAPAAPAATVAGLVVCAVSVVSTSLAAALAWIAWVPSAWIGGIAVVSDGLPGSLPWPAGAVGVLAATAMLVAIVVGIARARTGLGMVTAGVIAALVVAGVQTPRVVLAASVPDWLIAQCDVGQGSATLMRVEGAIVLVDTGPDPELLESCTALLGVDRIDVLVLTHFDLDHVGGASAVLGSVGTLVHGPVDVDGAALVDELVAAGAAASQVRRGDAIVLGERTIDVLWPSDGDSPGNDASVVVRVEWSTMSAVVLGDLGAEAQRRLGAVPPSDVVVVAHHGSGDQHLGLYEDIDPAVAIVPVGENDYGHPVPAFLDGLTGLGIAVLRTDVDGAIVLDGVGVWLEHPP